jgi:CBS domain-containing protein
VGDEVVLGTESLGLPPRRGRVLEILVTGGEQHYRVAWADGRESLIFPGPDMHLVHHAPSPRPTEPIAPGRVAAGLDRPAATDPVRAIMSAPVSEVDGQASLRELAEALASAGVGALMVVGDGRTLGVVSERDVVRALAQGGDPDVARAADVVATETVWARPSDTIRHVAGLMWEAEVRHIPLRENGKAIGMVSIRDILDALVPAWTDKLVHPVPDI